MDGFFDIAMGIVFIGLATTLVIHPNTSNVVNAAGNAFSNSLGTAIKGQLNVPAVNPFIDPGANVEAIDGSPVNFGPSIYTIRQQDPRPGAIASPTMNVQGVGGGYASQVNAAGTSENVATHVAILVILALVGVYALRKSGFKFVVAGSVG